MGVDWGSGHFISGKGGSMHRLQWQTLRSCECHHFRTPES